MAILIEAADYPIKSVTVFKSSKAEVVRTFNLSLKKGQNKVDISGLSGTIDTQSVRISGLGSEVRLLDIVTTVKNASVEYSPTSSAEVIRTLQEKIAALESATAIKQQGSALLTTYGETLTGEHVSPEQMDKFLSTYFEREKKRLDESLNVKEEILKLQRRIITEREKASSKKGTAHGHVDAVLITDSDTRIEMTVTYIVSNTTWKPTYELHATTENGKPSPSVTLHYRARVNQSTGEDWSNTTLTLSTVSSDTVARQIPHLRPVTLHRPSPSSFREKKVKQNNFGPFWSNTIGPGTQGIPLFGSLENGPRQQQQQQQRQQQQQQQYQQQQQQQQQVLSTGFASQNAYSQPAAFPQSRFGGAQQPAAQSTGMFGSTVSGGGGFGAAPAEPPASPSADDECLQDEEFEEFIEGPGSDPITIVTETPMAISFSVNGESNIPSDGVDHQVSVAVLPFSAKISYIAIPRIDPRVFLQCEVKNTSEYRLLPGPVFVILDDSYVSKTTINDVNTGDDFKCTLGDDASAKVTYERTSKTVKSDGGTFSEVTNTTTYTTKISIHNKHQFAINDLIVRDVIPTCEDKRLKIVLRKPKGLADAKQGEWVDVTADGLRVGWEKVVDGKGGEKEGRFEWRWKVDTGAKVNLYAEWEVKAPGEIAWMEMV